MISLTLAEVASAVGGTLQGADGAAVITRVCLDSRECRPGDLFVAIVGETHDGHDHVAAALSAGATAAVVSHGTATPSIVVDDTIIALGRLARAVLDRLPQCQVIAITGSSGKTSTKDLVAQVLESAAPTVAPPGSFNNEIGLPTTVLRADEDTRFLVMEMGMRGLGHIAYLCEIAPPHIAVVTNVGSAHLELLGSREAIAEAKSEIVTALDASGVAVLNQDDDLVAAMRVKAPGRVVTYGRSTESEVSARDVVLDDLARPSFTLAVGADRHPVRLAVHGAHQVSNALAAAAVGIAVGMSVSEVAAALTSAGATSRWRMEVVTAPSGVLVVNDAYNANPESMTAALDSLAAMASGRTTWAVIGEMREIGDSSAEQHANIGEVLLTRGIDHLVAVGDGARPVYDAVVSRMGTRAQWVADVDDALLVLQSSVGEGDVVLVKASRAIGLERVAEGLLAVGDRKDGAL